MLEGFANRPVCGDFPVNLMRVVMGCLTAP